MNDSEILKLFPEKIGKGLLFVFSDEDYDYFEAFVLKEEGKDAEVFHRKIVKMGTYQDAIYCCNDASLYLSEMKFMYYPYVGNRLRFREWMRKYEPVFIYNDGLKDLECDTPYGIFLIPPKETCLCDEKQMKYRIEKPIAIEADRHGVNDIIVKDGKKVGYGRPNNDPQIIDISKEGKDDGNH